MIILEVNLFNPLGVVYYYLEVANSAIQFVYLAIQAALAFSSHYHAQIKIVKKFCLIGQNTKLHILYRLTYTRFP